MEDGEVPVGARPSTVSAIGHPSCKPRSHPRRHPIHPSWHTPHATASHAGRSRFPPRIRPSFSCPGTAPDGVGETSDAPDPLRWLAHGARARLADSRSVAAPRSAQVPQPPLTRHLRARYLQPVPLDAPPLVRLPSHRAARAAGSARRWRRSTLPRGTERSAAPRRAAPRVTAPWHP